MLLQKNKKYLLLCVVVAVVHSSALCTSLTLFTAVPACSCFSCLCSCRKQGRSTFDSHSIHPRVYMQFNSNSIQLCMIFASFHSILVRQREVNGRCLHLHRHMNGNFWKQVAKSDGVRSRLEYNNSSKALFDTSITVVNRHFCFSLCICLT